MARPAGERTGAGNRLGTWRDALAGLLVAASGCLLYVTRLSDIPMGTNDEALYANVARESLRTGSLVVPHVSFNHFVTPAIGYQPFLLKPPLVIWFQAVAIDAFGPTKFAARLPTALCGVAAALLLYAVGTRVYDRATGLVGAAVFLTFPTFVSRHGIASATMDVPLLLFGSAFVYGLLRTTRDPTSRWLAVAGPALGLAVMTKGLAAGVFVLVSVPLLPALVRSRGRWWGCRAAVSLGLGAAVVVPWVGVAWLRHGGTFVRTMVVEQVLRRSAGGLRTYPATFDFMKYPYFRELPRLAEPWLPFVVAAVAVLGAESVTALARDGSKRFPSRPANAASDGAAPGPTLFLIWWTASVFGAFVVAGNHQWYVYPAFFPAALLAGRLLVRARRRWSPSNVGMAAAAFAVPFVSASLGPYLLEPAAGAVGLELGVVRLVAGVAAAGVVLGVYPVVGPQSEVTARLPGGFDVDYAVGVALLLVLVPTLSMGVSAVSGWNDFTTRQERIGERVDAAAGADDAVCLHPSTADVPISTLLFFADRPVAAYPGVETTPDGGDHCAYAVVARSRVDSVDARFERFGTIAAPDRTDVTVLELAAGTAANATRRGAPATPRSRST